MKKSLPPNRSKFLYCSICGQHHITQKALDYVMEKTGLPKTELLICPRCRQEKMGKKMLTGVCSESAMQPSRSKFLYCSICGQRHVTQKVFDYVIEKTGLPEAELLICPVCRRKKIGKDMLKGICSEKI